MPFLLLKLLGIGKWLREGATALLGAIGRHPWQAAVIALIALSGWLWHGKSVQHAGWQAEIAARKADKEQWEQASAANLAAAKKHVAETEARYTAQAKESDHDYRIELAGALERGRAYAAAHRMRANTGIGAAAPAPASDSPGVPADPAAFADMVAVRPSDIDACTVDHEYAMKAHDWAKGLIAEGLARPVVPDPAFGQ